MEAHRYSGQPDGLAGIVHSGINLFVWMRPTPALDPGFLAALARCEDLEFSTGLAVRDGTHEAWRFPDLKRLPRQASQGNRCAMEADVNLLARLIARTLRPEIIRVTLVSVSSDMCRKFHSDHVPVRALCSYHGAGTLWLDNHDVIRGELGCPGHGSFEEANAAVMKPGAKVRQLSRGWVAWMKGEAWPGNEGNGLVHRSPPHDPAAGPRLILKLDALYPGGVFPRQ